MDTSLQTFSPPRQKEGRKRKEGRGERQMTCLPIIQKLQKCQGTSLEQIKQAHDRSVLTQPHTPKAVMLQPAIPGPPPRHLHLWGEHSQGVASFPLAGVREMWLGRRNAKEKRAMSLTPLEKLPRLHIIRWKESRAGEQFPQLDAMNVA